MTKNYNENYVREAAYFNWQNAGCPNGQDEYFWTMAMNQLYGSNNANCGCSKASKGSSSKSCASKSGASKSSAKKTSSKK